MAYVCYTLPMASLVTQFKKAVFDGIQKYLATRNTHAERVLQTQVDLVVNKADMFTHPTQRYAALDKHSIPLQDHALKTHAALIFHSDARIARTLDGMKTITGQPLLETGITPDGRKCLHIWNETTQQRDTHEEIHASRDMDTGAQFAVYYDVANKRISFNFGGTDITNLNDLASVAQTAIGVVNMRMTSVKPFIDAAMEQIKAFYPDALPDTPIDIYAHSAGVNAIPLANYFMQREHGIIPRAQVMLDPFGARNSFEIVADMVAKAEGCDKTEILAQLTHNTQTYKVAGGTFIDGMQRLDKYNYTGRGNAPATIGRVEKLNIAGNAITAHLAKSWIKFFNMKEVETLSSIASGKKSSAVRNTPAKGRTV